MIVYRNSRISKKFKKNVIAIGNFDGLHLGHQKVLNQARLQAKKNNLKFGVVTFEPMPVMFFNKSLINHRINSLEQKISFLKKSKLDFLIIIKFNKKFSNYTPEKFIKNIIYKNLKAKYIFVSKNFRFGKKRKGNIKTLKENEKLFFYKTIIAKPLKKNKKILSSTIIRRNISKGNIIKANEYLGRNWSILGKVIKGKKRGRKIGFPTCNIKLNDYILPKPGVYSVQVKVKNFTRKGIANVGYRPTFNGKILLLEVNIFGIKANLYDKSIKVSFINFVRAEKKFKNINQLKNQIKKDIKKVKI
ncbi:MAG: riboflavin biosynthesis protein RibF [Pelagibacteraceae bacterium TMED287]|nr:MAG: riboflavin biosynthesis protein RibF [Pelagibacteraceae bacterium TMED287]|tara:strand:- start:655 stop:1563 length:909 start_codon:yes stop_codon:yes gene_type:complete